MTKMSKAKNAASINVMLLVKKKKKNPNGNKCSRKKGLWLHIINMNEAFPTKTTSKESGI